MYRLYKSIRRLNEFDKYPAFPYPELLKKKRWMGCCFKN